MLIGQGFSDSIRDAIVVFNKQNFHGSGLKWLLSWGCWIILSVKANRLCSLKSENHLGNYSN
ncbi:MAG: hypothetical protein LH702_12805, partial [Phormidesmis sp. CAN_BIN44]|nr:hypothetical protein [Phormidesmis sp. CAN_BIN44]